LPPTEIYDEAKKRIARTVTLRVLVNADGRAGRLKIIKGWD